MADALRGLLKAEKSAFHLDQEAKIAIEPGSVTFPICEAVIDNTAEVSEAEIAVAMQHIARADHWMVEGAAGVALAGLIQRPDLYRDKKVAVVLCGRNIDPEVYLSAMSVKSR